MRRGRALQLLAAYVAGYDTWAALTDHQSISQDYLDVLHQHPVTVSLVTAYLLFHLYGALPRHFDPLRSLGYTVQERRHGRRHA